MARRAVIPALVFVLACYGPTEVTLDVTTDIDCQKIDTAIFVKGASAPIAETPACTPGATENAIGSLVLAPSGARDAHLTVEVVVGTQGTNPLSCHDAISAGAKVDATCAVSRRAIAFSPHQQLSVPVRIYKDCLGVTCPTNETCSAGQCVELVECTDSSCPDAGPPLAPPGTPPPPPPPPPAPTGGDGGTIDAGGPCGGPAGDGVLASNVTLSATRRMIAGNGSRIFWVQTSAVPSSGHVASVRRDGSQPLTYTQEVDATSPIAASDAYAFAVSDVTGYAIPADNGSVVLVFDSGQVTAMTWSATGAGTAQPAVFLAQSNQIAYHAPQTPGTQTFFSTAAQLIAAEGSYIFWTSSNQLARKTGANVPAQTALTGTPSALAAPIAGPPGMFVTLGDTGDVDFADESPTIVTTKVGTALEPTSVAADADTIYVVEHVADNLALLRIGRIPRFPAGAGAGFPAATALNGVRFKAASNILVDGSCVYVWAIGEKDTSTANGKILAFPK